MEGMMRAKSDNGQQKDDALITAMRWHGQGRQVAIARVVETWGSSPRPCGAALAIDADGNFEGSVSGGCVEGDVITQALEVIETKRPQLLDYGVADETAWKVGLTCGGRIRIYVEAIC